MPDVFLSYTSADRAFADRLQRALSAKGLDVFWDQEVPPGRDWDEWIRAKLGEARLVIVLWSATSVKSPNVRHEAMIARDAGKLVPLMIEALKPDDFPMGLYLVQALKLEGWTGDAADARYQRLEVEVFARLKREAPATRSEPKRGPAPLLIGAGLAAAVAVAAYVLVPPAMIPAANEAAEAAPVSETAQDQVEAPPPAAAAPAPFDFVLGRWDWGQGCENPSIVTAAVNEASSGATEAPTQYLVFATEGSRFVHEVSAVGERVADTVVLEPQDFTGDIYRLSGDGQSLTVTQVAPTKEVNQWTRCP